MKFPRSFSLANATLGALSLSFGLSLVACGSDSSSSKDDGNKTPDGIDQFESMDDLVHCTKSHFGEVAYVTEKDSIYECTSEGWVVADSAKVEEILSSSDSKSDSDGKSSGSKDDSGDSDEKSSSSEKASAEDTVKVEVVKVDSVKVTGLAQKGPFTSGSAVTLYGLDSSFARTKTKFTGKVSGDSGAFSVEKIVLGSQYAELEVNGFYKNALTGKNTSGTKTRLSALVDLSAGKDVKANVNLFTEFEKARALQLVKKEKYNVPAAKMRASREIVNVFGNVYGGKKIDSASVPSATSISLSDTGSVGAALYAAGVMMTQNLSVSKSASLIGDVAEDIAADGSWNSDTSRAAVADNLCAQDSVDGFAAARTNLKYMKLAASVPNFESNLRYFWNEVYGLGECTEELETAETIRKVTNKQSDNYGAGFACTSRRWHKVTALDTELGMCTSKMEGQYRESNLSKNTEYYVCKQGTWAKISEVQYNLKECTEEKAKAEKTAYVTVKDSFFVCKDKQWTALTATQYELKDCTKDREGKLTTAGKDEENFVCENGAWRDATPQESAFGLCLKADGTRKQLDSDKKYYACLEKGWTAISVADGINGFCTAEINDKLGADEKGNKTYKCSNESWVECSADISGTVIAEDVCEKTAEVYAWRELNAFEKINGYCNVSKSGDVAWSGEFWTSLDVSHESFLPGADVSETPHVERDDDGKLKNGNAFYVCDGNAWTEIKGTAYAYGVTCANDEYRFYADQANIKRFVKLDVFPSTAYVEYGFSEETIRELQLAIYDTYAASIFVAGKDTLRYVVCDDNDWIQVSETDYNLKATCSLANDGKIIDDYVCIKEAENYVWTQCVADNENDIVEDRFACIKKGSLYAWRELEPGEKLAGKLCSKETHQQFAYDANDVPYRCMVASDGSVSWKKFEFETVSIKGKAHKIIDIGDRTWMAENLNLEGYPCAGGDCDLYGSAFYWKDAVGSDGCETLSAACDENHQGICPSGWHIPSEDEWKALYAFVKETTGLPYDRVGFPLMARKGWTCFKGECNGSDLYGFAALPSGYRYLNNGEYHYSDLGEEACFHVAKGKYEGIKGSRYYIDNGGSFGSGFIGLDQGIPVRCVKNP